MFDGQRQIQPLVSRGQIVSVDLPLLTDRQTDGQIITMISDERTILFWQWLEVRQPDAVGSARGPA